MTAIAVGIGKHTSTVSREIRGRSVEGLYLPFAAHEATAAARARPKQSKLVTDQKLHQAVEDGLSKRWSPEEISHRLVKDFPDDESMRVSHETIYQALYFQARGERDVKWPKHFGLAKPDANRIGILSSARSGSSTRCS